MKLHSYLTAFAVLAATVATTPAFADPGRGRGHGNDDRGRHHADRGHHRDAHRGPRHVANCPPGLAKKNPPCIPPGQVRNARHGNHVGDVLRVSDYFVIRDPRRYNLEQRRGWDYYRDDDRIYRVDSGTRRVLAVLNLIDAFTN